MNPKRAAELLEAWGDKPCDHPRVEPLGHGIDACAQCGRVVAGETFSRLVSAQRERDSRRRLDPQVARARVRRRVIVVGWVQIVAAAWVLLFSVFVVSTGPRRWTLIALTSLFVGVNLAAGILTVRRRVVGYWMSLWNHVAQIPTFAVGTVMYHYAGLGGVMAYYSFHGRFGVEAYLEAGLRVRIGPPVGNGYIGVDLLAVGFVLLLLSAIDSGRREPLTRQAG
jgi:hypothetical protein